MRKQSGFLLLLWLVALLFRQAAYAQSVTLSDFKIDDSTNPVKVYGSVSASRDAKFTAKATSSSYAMPNLNVTIQRTGSAGQSIVPNVFGTSYSNVVQTWNGQAYVGVVTIEGTVRIDNATALYGGYNALRAVNTSGGSVTSSSSSISMQYIADPTAPPAIAITNFTINNQSTVDISATPKTVTYRLTLSKDPGYTDGFTVLLRGVSSSGPASAPINSTYFYAPGGGVTAGWTKSGGQLVFSVAVQFNLSTADVGASDVRLVAHASSSQNYLIGSSSNASTLGYVALNRISVPCISDVFLQNTTSLTGTITSGKSIFAGRAVTSTTNGDVVIGTGVTAEFVARESVALEAGFSAAAGATFSAYLDGSVCSTARLAEEEPSEPAQYATVRNEARRANEPVTMSEPASQQVTIYPNPAQNELVISLANNQEGARKVVIYDSYGTAVQRTTMPSEQAKLNVQGLESGIYYLHVTQDGQTIKTRFSIAR